MKFCTYALPADGLTRVGCLTAEGRIVPLTEYADMTDLIRRYASEKELIATFVRAAEQSHVPDAASVEAAGTATLDPAAVVRLAPVTAPGKMIFVGLNYLEHAKESNMAPPEKPVLFAKFANSLAGDGATVAIPPETSECDYEVELAVVIGRKARRVSEAEALDHVFGYTVCNDISARELQLREGSQWTRGKAIDGFAPMGPVVVTADELDDPHDLAITCRVNGETRQNTRTSELIFNVPQLIAFLSLTMTLEPGDIISTGTPSGVAAGMKQPRWLQPGDKVETEIEGIGVLTVHMVAE